MTAYSKGDLIVDAITSNRMTALEKAARACGEADGFDWDDFSPDRGIHEGIRDEYRAQARAVLMAVRELQEEADAGALIAGRAVLPEFDEPLQEDAQACFTAMIDAILAEVPE